ncbi:acireductone synthase [Cyanobium sp. Morenito 9A2]|nr:acireductone synthase [Cyanobium sp. Morenito 9A2]
MSQITHLLLDIEGTTCPVSFVAETLFPFARRHLKGYLERHRQEAAVGALLEEAERARASDPEASAIGADQESFPQLVNYLEWLMDQDRKLTPLKQLQGLIWESGYASGELKAPLFEDVCHALSTWSKAGLTLAVYSSGSVKAQKLLYGHTTDGDLSSLFRHWFDTRTGPKQASKSYLTIAKEMGTEPSRITFISDSVAELKAAHGAGLKVIFSDRPGNPGRQSNGYPVITRLEQLTLDQDIPR